MRDELKGARIRGRRRPDWLLTLAMLIGGVIPTSLVGWATFPSYWGLGVCVVMFWPCAFAGGIVALIGEPHDAR